MKLSIIIPAYNEQERILPVLKDYYKTFRKAMGDDFEIIVLPNNCSDDTHGVVERYSGGNPQIMSINIPHKTGKGGAVYQGFAIADGDYIGFTDADESISAKEYLNLFANIGDHEGIIGSRRIKGACIEPKRTFIREMTSLAFNLIVRILFFPFPYKDSQCGAKIFKKDVAKTLASKCEVKGWTFDVEMLHVCKCQKFSIKEHPVYWKEVEGSKLF